MTGIESGLAEVDGGKLAWESAGEGPDVVFLHPGLWDSRVWDQQFGVFSKTYHVVRYDLRGYGRSSRPEPGKSYSHVDDFAAVVERRLEDRLDRDDIRGLRRHRGATQRPRPEADDREHLAG